SAESPRPGSEASATWLLESRDRGRTWLRLGPMRKERVFAIQVEPAGAVRAATESGVYARAARAPRHPDPAPPGAAPSASSARNQGASILYGTTRIEGGPGAARGGLYVSDDGGRSWRGANGTLMDVAAGLGQGETWGDAKGSRPGLGPVAAS